MKKVIIICCITLFSSIDAMEHSLSREERVTKFLLTAFLTLQHPDKVISARYNNKATRLITTTADGTVRLWDAKSGNMRREFSPRDYWLCFFKARFTSADFSPEGEHFVLPTDNEATFVYNTEIGQEIYSFKRPWASKFIPAAVNSATYSRKGRYIVTTQSDGTYLWDPRTAKLAHHYALPKIYRAGLSTDSGTVLSADSNAAETHVVVASSKDKAYIYDMRSSTCFTELDNEEIYKTLAWKGKHPSSNPVTSVKFRPEDDTLLTAFKNGIFLWDINGCSQKKFNYLKPVTSATINNEGYLAISFEDALELYDQATEAFSNISSKGPIASLAFDQSGGKLVSTSGRQAIAWEIDTIKEYRLN